MLEKHKRINITLPESIEAQLSDVARETNSKKSHIIAQALNLYMDELDLRVAEARYNTYKTKNEKTYSLDEVKQEIE